MAQQYWIGDVFVDVSRNQVTHNKQSQTVPPKALAVLTHLAKSPHQVVSQEALLQEVWRDTIVLPNSLQRCIAQLRKVLGNDGKGQSVIQTHAKQGYSLECDVRWQREERSTNDTHPVPSGVNDSDSDGLDTPAVPENHAQQPERSVASVILVLLAISIAVLVLSALGDQYFGSKKKAPIAVSGLRLLTATDDKEFDASYSPDGQHMVFHRYLDKQCVNKLWAKNLATQEEVVLIQEWGAYGSHSFSRDGSQLIFLATDACDTPVTQSDCYDLVKLDFQKALLAPQQPELLLQCKNSVIRKPSWLDDDRIALLQNQFGRWKLISYSVELNTSTEVYSLAKGSVMDYTYSDETDQIAIINVREDGRPYIDLIDPSGELISSHLIKLPKEIPAHRPIYPDFIPNSDHLLFSTGRQLFTLSLTGDVSPLGQLFPEPMARPEFDKSGKRLLMIRGPYDSDVARLSRADISKINPESHTQDVQWHTSKSFHRSTLGEDYALFQPGGRLIAFWSERSGSQQVWISDGETPQQLTQFPIDTYIRGIAWAADGQSLLINANSELKRVYLDSDQQAFSLEYPIRQLFHWNSQTNSALVLARLSGALTLLELNLDSLDATELTEQRIKWAQKTDNGQLIYKDALDQFWQPGAAEPQRIPALQNQGSRADPFIVRGNTIFAINDDHQLWSFDLDNQRFDVLGKMATDVDYLTDINQSELLLTVRVAAKKEVVELLLED